MGNDGQFTEIPLEKMVMSQGEASDFAMRLGARGIKYRAIYRALSKDVLFDQISEDRIEEARELLVEQHGQNVDRLIDSVER